MKRIGILLFLLFIAYFIFLIRQDIIDNLDLRREKGRLESALERGQGLSARLSDRLARLKNDDLVEEIARKDLGLVKKGETAYKVIDK